MKTKKLLAVLLCLALLPLNVPLVARADDSEIFGANIQPNIMLLIDSSGSMGSDYIYADPYNPGQTYTGTYTPTVVYQYGKTCVNVVIGYDRKGRPITQQQCTTSYSLYKNTVADVKDSQGADVTTAQTALNTLGKWSGTISGTSYNLYMGNLLNWQATPGAQLVQKIVVAKRVLTNLVSGTEGVRFGLAQYKNNTNSATTDGAAILSPIGSSTADIVTQINSISPSGYTPLGEALRDLGTYYKHQAVYQKTSTGYVSTTFADPIQFACQPNFVILMTDGLQNGSVDVAGQATLRRTQDHSSLGGLQNVIVDTIGFAVTGTDRLAANALLTTTATNGGGTFYDTESEQQLETALQDAIRKIIAATFTFATPVIPTTSATGLARAYLAAVQSNPMRPSWRGFLKAYNRDASGQVVTNTDGTPNEATDCYVDSPANTKPCLAWEAGSILNGIAAADRKIYTATAINGARGDFTTANSDLTATLLGVADDTAKNKVINFLRGIDTIDENGNGNTTEEREWKLGDIFHSTPVVVGAPFLPGQDSDYTTFRTTYASRTAVVIAGANDGMLHGFRESDGVEQWAFIPPDQLPKIKNLAQLSGEHVFSVDSSPVAADVKIQVGTDASPQWHTIVIVGERRGGGYYHALDITDPSASDYPKYLWSFTDAKITESWSEPVIGKVKMADGTAKYVAIFGGGFNTSSNNATGAAVFVVDVEDGTLLWQYTKGTNTDDRQKMNFSIPANPLALDLNNDGYIDRVYIGDVGGQIWKLDLSAAATLTDGLVTNWTGKRFFRALADNNTLDPNPPTGTGQYTPQQAIYAPINAAMDKDGNLWLYVGTGDRNHPNDPSVANRFYAIKDTQTTMTQNSVLRESDLVSSTTITSTTTVTNGWFLALATAEKVLAAADVFNSLVFFSTFTPSTTAACGSGGGTAKLYSVGMKDGFAGMDPSNSLPYANMLATGQKSADVSNKDTTGRYTTIGTGIPSKPIIIISDMGTTISTSVIAATTSQQLPSNPAPPPSAMRQILYWKENFQ